MNNEWIERKRNNMEKNVVMIGNMKVKVVSPENIGEENLDIEDQDMDKRAVAAVKSAINKAKVCNKPIAKYDARRKQAYVLMPDGEKKYVQK